MATSLSIVAIDSGGSVLAQTNPAILKTVADVPLPGAANRLDYQSLDPQSGRLYIAHLAGDSVIVFDVKKQEVIKDIQGVPRAHGVLWVLAERRLYASATGEAKIAVIDPTTLQVEARIPSGKYPDGIAYDPIGRKLYVSDEKGGASVVIDARNRKFLKSIPLGGDVGNTQYDADARLMWVAVGETNDLVAIDPRTDEIVGRYPLPGAAQPHGLYLDLPRHLAFVACQKNARLLVFDLRAKRVVAEHAIGENADVLAFDPAWRRLYVACESGVVNVFDENGGSLVSRDEYRFPHAHTVAVDPETHRIFLPLQDVDGKPLLKVMKSEPPVR